MNRAMKCFRLSVGLLLPFDEQNTVFAVIVEPLSPVLSVI